jgi:hypothetical protein
MATSLLGTRVFCSLLLLLLLLLTLVQRIFFRRLRVGLDDFIGLHKGDGNKQHQQ